ncbi:MAG: hypothetical protein R2844_02695 [Caldilineales bacterium]
MRWPKAWRESLRSADQVSAGERAASLRYAGDKTFVNRSGVWVDTAFTDAQPQQEIAFGGAAYFDLLAQHPEWRDYLAVSPNLIVVLEGTAYVIADTGETLAEPPTAPTAANPSATVLAEPLATPSVATAPPPDVTPIGVAAVPTPGSEVVADRFRRLRGRCRCVAFLLLPSVWSEWQAYSPSAADASRLFPRL